MKNNELIERYIYSITRHLNKSERDDIAKELHSIIDDMIAEQYGDKEPNEYQLKALLSELGTPLELYEKYSQDGSDCLIGAPYFSVYKFVIKLVSICVIFGMILASVITFFMQEQTLIETISSFCSDIVESLLGGFALVTILFAYLYRKQVKIDEVFSNMDNLPELPTKEKGMSKVSSIIGIVCAVVFAISFLTCPWIFSTINRITGEIIPILNYEYIQSTWYVITIIAVLGVTGEIIKLVEGRYTKKVLLFTAIENVISAVLSVFWLMNDKILNSALVEAIQGAVITDDIMLSNIMSHFNMVFLVIILFALVVDFVDTLVKTEK